MHARVAVLLIGTSLLIVLEGTTLATFGNWPRAHGLLAIAGLVAGIEALHAFTLRSFRNAPPRHGDALSFGIGSLLLGLGLLLQPSGIFQIIAIAGIVAMTAATVRGVPAAMAALPGRAESVVTDDPLTKGDDACYKHLRLARIFLPIGLAGIAASLLVPDPWSWRVGLASGHILLVGYGLLSMYGLGHLWVPRFSGVPAIAAGAIKGELHSTMPALILLPLGFMLDHTGIIIAGGAFAFLGFFTYMGVLGANIMRNKSRTQRVTPEFVYVPWTFMAIFWLVSGVLLGVFLRAVPEQLADHAGGLTWIHMHMALAGGMGMLLLGWLTRLGPRPARFDGPMRASFWLLNVGLVMAGWARFAGPDWLDGAAVAVIALGGFSYWRGIQVIMGRDTRRAA